MTNPDTPKQQVTTGWSIGTRLGWLLAIAVVVVGLDQVTKAYAIEYLKPDPRPRFYLGGNFILQYAENKGAFGSIFSWLSDQARWYVLTLGCAILLAGVSVYSLFAKTIDKPSFLALCLILAGGIGNLIDRFCYGTIVIDFLYIQFGVPWLHTNIFNIADVAITAGFFVLILPMIRDLFVGAPESTKTLNQSAA